MSAVAAAKNAAPNTACRKSFCTSSSTKIRPASGALNAAARPAPAPAAISTSLSRVPDVEPLRDRRAYGSAHLHGRPLAPQYQSRAQCQRPAKKLHRQYAPPVQVAHPVQHGLQMRNAAAGRFGRYLPHQQNRHARPERAKASRKQPAEQGQAVRPRQQFVAQSVPGGKDGAKGGSENPGKQAHEGGAWK